MSHESDVQTLAGRLFTRVRWNSVVDGQGHSQSGPGQSGARPSGSEQRLSSSTRVQLIELVYELAGYGHLSLTQKSINGQVFQQYKLELDPSVGTLVDTDRYKDLVTALLPELQVFAKIRVPFDTITKSPNLKRFPNDCLKCQQQSVLFPGSDPELLEHTCYHADCFAKICGQIKAYYKQKKNEKRKLKEVLLMDMNVDLTIQFPMLLVADSNKYLQIHLLPPIFKIIMSLNYLENYELSVMDWRWIRYLTDRVFEINSNLYISDVMFSIFSNLTERAAEQFRVQVSQVLIDHEVNNLKVMMVDLVTNHKEYVCKIFVDGVPAKWSTGWNEADRRLKKEEKVFGQDVRNIGKAKVIAIEVWPGGNVDMYNKNKTERVLCHKILRTRLMNHNSSVTRNVAVKWMSKHPENGTPFFQELNLEPMVLEIRDLKVLDAWSEFTKGAGSMGDRHMLREAWSMTTMAALLYHELIKPRKGRAGHVMDLSVYDDLIPVNVGLQHGYELNLVTREWTKVKEVVEKKTHTLMARYRYLIRNYGYDDMCLGQNSIIHKIIQEAIVAVSKYGLSDCDHLTVNNYILETETNVATGPFKRKLLQARRLISDKLANSFDSLEMKADKYHKNAYSYFTINTRIPGCFEQEHEPSGLKLFENLPEVFSYGVKAGEPNRPLQELWVQVLTELGIRKDLLDVELDEVEGFQ